MAVESIILDEAKLPVDKNIIIFLAAIDRLPCLENRHERAATERFRFFSYDELMARDKASLDIFWLKDDSLDNLDDLPPPDVLQQEIIEHLEAALASFREVALGLTQRGDLSSKEKTSG